MAAPAWDKNGFLDSGNPAERCQSCTFTLMRNKRLRRVTVCQGCRRAKPAKEPGTWSESIMERIGVGDV